MYYTMARSNQLSVAESTAFAVGGSLLWELFGEVREYISINDMAHRRCVRSAATATG